MDSARMNPEEKQELQQLIDFLKENGVAEFELERPDQKVSIKFATAGGSVDLASLLAQSRAAAPAPVAQAPARPAAEASSAPAAVNEDEGLHIVKSPIVGTFYESPSPGTPAFVNVGDSVENGQVLCIVEAMKLMNEIESDAAGEVVKRFVNSGQPVEYGQRLFALRPRS
jgi:acetyl-CoA carboxylase biotin carboxyl carrier protein